MDTTIKELLQEISTLKDIIDREGLSTVGGNVIYIRHSLDYPYPYNRIFDLAEKLEKTDTTA